VPNLTQPEPQTKPYRSPEPIRVLPADSEGSKINSAFSGNGYIQFDIPSIISRGRGGTYLASRLNVCPDGTVDFRMYGEVGDVIVSLQSDESGSLDLVLLPYYGEPNQGWRIPIDKILSDYSKLAPSGGEF